MTSPDDWLKPGFAAELTRALGASVTRGTAGLITVAVEETVQPPPTVVVTPAPGSAASAHSFGPGAAAVTRVRREVTYRESDQIPMRVVTLADGKEVRRVEVQELQLRRR